MAKMYKVGVVFQFFPDGEHAEMFDEIKDSPEKLMNIIKQLAYQDISDLAFRGELFNALNIEESETKE